MFFFTVAVTHWLHAVRTFSLLSVFAAVTGIVVSVLYRMDRVPAIIPGIAYLGTGKNL